MSVELMGRLFCETFGGGIVVGFSLVAVSEIFDLKVRPKMKWLIMSTAITSLLSNVSLFCMSYYGMTMPLLHILRPPFLVSMACNLVWITCLLYFCNERFHA